jgi:hypothetical protein
MGTGVEHINRQKKKPFVFTAWYICAVNTRHSFKVFIVGFKPTLGRAAAQAVSPGFPPRRPGFASGQHVGFVVDKAALNQAFSEYFDFPCQSSFHQFLHHHNHPGLAQ